MKKGMKQTEIGWIPEDWEVVPLGQLIKFIGGSQPPLSTFSREEKEGSVRMIQIRDYKTDKHKVYVPRKLARRFCEADDIMIGRYGPPVFQILRGLQGAYNVALIKAEPQATIWKEYAWHFLRTEKLFQFIDKLSQRSSGQTGVDLSELRHYSVPLPSIPEQQAIAEALSDADAWIESLEALLQKKRLIKQGVMQELLWPKEGWEVKKLGEVGVFLPTNSLSRDRLNYDSGLLRNLHYGDIHTKFRTLFNADDESVPFVNTDVRLRANFCLPGDLVMADASEDEDDIGKAIEIQSIGSVPIVAGLHTLHFRPKAAVFANGFLGWIWQSKFIKEQILKEAQGTKVLGISTSRIAEVEVRYPSIQEQQTTANFIANVEQEIEAIAIRITKARQIKQGMMQQLLTGQIRLAPALAQ